MRDENRNNSNIMNNTKWLNFEAREFYVFYMYICMFHSEVMLKGERRLNFLVAWPLSLLPFPAASLPSHPYTRPLSS